MFGPLGMQTATTDPDLARGQGLVVGYYHWLGVGYRPHAPPLPDGMVGGYRMFASASDVSRLLVLHLNNGQVDGEQVLTPDSVTRLQTGEGPETPVSYAGGLFVDPPGMPWMQGAIADYPVLRHDGSATSYRSYLWAMPGADFGLVLLVNANNWADESQLNRVAHNVPAAPEPPPCSTRPDTPAGRWVT